MIDQTPELGYCSRPPCWKNGYAVYRFWPRVTVVCTAEAVYLTLLAQCSTFPEPQNWT